MNKRTVISVIGSGGKSTYIKRKAEEYLAARKRVLIATSTHMRLSEYGCSQTVDEIAIHLKEHGWAIGGKPVHRNGVEKMGPLDEIVFRESIPLADVILIEADGSRGLPFKAPQPWEPVIYDATTQIVLLAGSKTLRHTIAECCYNHERICELTGKAPQDSLTNEDMVHVLRETYIKDLHINNPNVPIFAYLIGEETNWEYWEMDV